MIQVFYVGGGGNDIRSCRESLEKRREITIDGLTKDGQVAAFTGIVQSLEYLRHKPPDMCWRVTMRSVLLQDEIADTQSARRG